MGVATIEWQNSVRIWQKIMNYRKTRLCLPNRVFPQFIYFCKILAESCQHWQRKQESPPAWTQEAYRPPCSKYSLCCPKWVPPLAGYPLARVPPWARVPSWGVPPGQGTPPARVPPQSGYPPGQGTPPAGPGRVPPLAAPWHSGKCCKALWDTGTPPVDRQTDTCQNITFPSYYVRGR